MAGGLLCISQAATFGGGYVPGQRGRRYKARALGACAALTCTGARQRVRLLGTRRADHWQPCTWALQALQQLASQKRALCPPL